MSTVAVVVIVIVVIVVLGAAGYFAQAQSRRRGLRQRFGPEYDRAVEKHETTKEAEQELLARKKRHDELEIRPLDPAVRERHLTEWRQVQERFVDSPETAVTEADALLTRVMGERGYPTEGYEQQVADLSVEHAGTIDRYRTAHDISTRAETKKASTEDLRQAMVHYRALFNELLEIEDEGTVADRDVTDRDVTDRDVTDRTPAGTTTDASDDRTADTRTAADETDGTRTKAGTKAEAAAERAESAARTGTGRRTGRRENDEGA